MPNAVLAIDASSELCSVALARDGTCLERSADGRRAHSDLLLPMVRELLADAGLKLAELDGIAFASGPGGFTGLRLACGVAQGLAFGADLPVVAVGSLDALCFATGRQRVYACVDARMGELYCAAFERVGGDMLEAIAATVCAASAAPLPTQGVWVGCGSGFSVCAQALAARLGAAIETVVATPESIAPAVAALGALRLARGGGVAAALAAPLYVRNKVALTTDERLARGGRA